MYFKILTLDVTNYHFPCPPYLPPPHQYCLAIFICVLGLKIVMDNNIAMNGDEKPIVTAYCSITIDLNDLLF